MQPSANTCVCNRIDYKFLNKKLESFDWAQIYRFNNSNNGFEFFVQKLTEISLQASKSQEIKIAKRFAFHKPWMNRRLLKLVSQRSKLHKQSKREPFNASLLQKYRKYRNYVTSQIFHAKSEFYRMEYEKCRSNINEKWKFVNKVIRQDFSNSAAPKRIKAGDKDVTNPLELAECFNNHFIEIGKQLADKLPASNVHFESFMTQKQESNIQFHFEEVLEDEVFSIINQLNTATGYDKISVKLLKENLLTLTPVLTFLINLAISTSTFPDCLKTARVTALHKKGSKLDLTNYRPISILPVLSKVLEKVMARQIRVYMEDFNFFVENQYGFREKRNTTSAINVLLEKLYNNLDKGKVTHSVFLDLSKAFDTVDHKILIEKLQFYNFSESAHSFIKSYLTKRSQFVSISNVSSSMREINIGVPQGSILGPLLFLIFINDLAYSIPNMEAILFADDTTVFSTEFLVLQDQINQVSNWCLANKLIINTQKTLSMHFKNPQKHLLSPFNPLFINNSPLLVTDTALFLGITIDEKISFNQHIAKLCNKLIYVILMLRHAKQYFDTKTMVDLYYTFFYPHLLYGLEFWGHASSTELDRILVLQKKALRIILKLQPNATVVSNFATLKIMPIRMLFKYRFLLHFINNYPSDTIKDLVIHHHHETRLKASNAITTAKFKTNKGQRSMLFSAAKLFNTYLHDYGSMDSESLKLRLAGRLWEEHGGGGVAGASRWN